MYSRKEATMALFDMLRNALLAGFGVQEKVKDFIDDLVKKGELSESQGAKLVKEWSEKAEKNTEDISKSLGELLETTLSKMNLTTKSDIEKIEEKINSLAARLDTIEKS
jgi:polyhydroxyalkanoate synthesis regulator phasin